jgi:hypothetical protein
VPKFPCHRHDHAAFRRSSDTIEKRQEPVMSALFAVSFDTLVMTAITCIALREVFLVALPDEIAGPGGWLINTDRD